MSPSSAFADHKRTHARPAPGNSLLNTLAEMRALAEIGSYYGTRRLLERTAPRGDGHPVMVLPGFMASDALTRAMRDFLTALGYETHAWELGRNPGLRIELCERLEERIATIRADARRRVSLIGWSLGGMYARAIAHRRTADIRQVITLGTPLSITSNDSVNSAIARAYTLLNPGAASDPLMASGVTSARTPVPSTSIFSFRDGIVPWYRCVEHCDEQTENIRVRGTHTGMTHNPVVLRIVAERLGQREYAWRPFRPAGLNVLLSRPFCASEAA